MHSSAAILDGGAGSLPDLLAYTTMFLPCHRQHAQLPSSSSGGHHHPRNYKNQGTNPIRDPPPMRGYPNPHHSGLSHILPLRAHLKIVPVCSSTILLCASPALQYHGRHTPAAAGCLSPRPWSCGRGAGHGRWATGVTTGFILRVPAIGYRVPTAAGVVLQGQAAPRRRAQSSGAPYPCTPVPRLPPT